MREIKLRVALRRELAEGVVGLRLEGAGMPEWAPGAHVDVVLSSGLERQYSLCGDPADRAGLEIAILNEPEGRGGSRWICEELREGDELGVHEPRNHFPLVEAGGYLFIAGGIGITPIIPMLREVDARGAQWRLIYGGRSRRSMAFLDHLAQYGHLVQVCPQDEVGLLDLETAVGSAPSGTAVYCCGPEPLLAALEDVGSRRSDVGLHLERFVPKQVEVPETERSFEIELASDGRVLRVPPDMSVLDALHEAGAALDYSCLEGTCGTCETGVLAGEVDHRDSLLTDAEQAANDVMFPCVSRSKSDRLVLDL